MPLFNPAILPSVPPRGAYFDGLGATVRVGSYAILRFYNDRTIVGFSIEADGISPTVTIDIWKIGAGTALPTIANTILTGGKLQLTTGNAINSISLANFTSTTITAGDIIIVYVSASNAALEINFGLNLK